MKFGRTTTAAVLTLASTIDMSSAFISPSYQTNPQHKTLTTTTTESPTHLPRRSFVLPSTAAQSPTETQTIPDDDDDDDNNDATSADDIYSNLSPEFSAAKEKLKAGLASTLAEETSNSNGDFSISPGILETLDHFINEYFTSCDIASRENSSVTPETTAKAMSDVLAYGLQHGFKKPFLFSTSHKALRGIDPEAEDGNTVDYYKFGVDFFAPCIDVEKSPVLGLENLDRAVTQLEDGHNVVFLANHQSEADPQVVSVCFDKVGFNKVAEDMIYVAGHKVTTDPLAVPFSMGRNLICIHSKKHINADPDTKPTKMKQNLGAMGDMLKMLASPTGTALWVAPSGGRDRRNVETGDIPIAPFDQKTVDMFRLMGNKSKRPTHFYALSMRTYDLCPPPDVVESSVGEKRNVRFGPVGVSVSEELIMDGGLESREAFCKLAFEKCGEGYDELVDVLVNGAGDGDDGDQ